MPRNTNTVISIVPLACANTAAKDLSVPPQKFPAKTPDLNMTSPTTMKTAIGTILAIVTMRLMAAAP